MEKKIIKFSKIENLIMQTIEERYPKGSKIVLWTFMSEIQKRLQLDEQELFLKDFIDILIDMRNKGVRFSWSWNLKTSPYPFIMIG